MIYFTECTDDLYLYIHININIHVPIYIHIFGFRLDGPYGSPPNWEIILWYEFFVTC